MVSNRGPSAYQPNALPLGQTSSLPLNAFLWTYIYIYIAYRSTVFQLSWFLLALGPSALVQSHFKYLWPLLHRWVRCCNHTGKEERKRHFRSWHSTRVTVWEFSNLGLRGNHKNVIVPLLVCWVTCVNDLKKTVSVKPSQLISLWWHGKQRL